MSMYYFQSHTHIKLLTRNPTSRNISLKKLLKDNLIALLSIKDTDSIIKNLPKQKAPSPDVFIGKFYQIFKEEIKILYNLFQKVDTE